MGSDLSCTHTHTHTHTHTEVWNQFQAALPKPRGREGLTSHFIPSETQGSKTRVFEILQIISARFSPGLLHVIKWQHHPRPQSPKRQT